MNEEDAWRFKRGRWPLSPPSLPPPPPMTDVSGRPLIISVDEVLHVTNRRRASSTAKRKRHLVLITISIFNTCFLYFLYSLSGFESFSLSLLFNINIIFFTGKEATRQRTRHTTWIISYHFFYKIQRSAALSSLLIWPVLVIILLHFQLFYVALKRVVAWRHIEQNSALMLEYFCHPSLCNIRVEVWIHLGGGGGNPRLLSNTMETSHLRCLR